jgi:hypothetical protein
MLSAAGRTSSHHTKSVDDNAIGNVSRLFCVDFKPSLRNIGAEVYEKSAVKVRDFKIECS